jgi:hypothetical protein
MFCLAALGAMGVGLTVWSEQLVERDHLGFLLLVGAQSLIALGGAVITRRAPDMTRLLAIVVVFAIAPRLYLMLQKPTLSGDIYRYVWDGRVDIAGFNPFLHVPASPELAFLRDETIYPWVDKKDYAITVYPPVSQAIFSVNALLGGRVTTLKALLLGLEGLGAAALISLLASLRLPRTLAVLYLWHPAPVWEIAANGHSEAAVIGLMLSAFAWGVARKRSYLAGALIALGALVKPTAALALPSIWRPFDPRLPAFVLSVVLLCYAPFLSAGAGVLGFTGGYAREQGLGSGTQFYALRLLAGDSAPPVSAVVAYYVVAAAVLLGLIVRACSRRDAALETSLTDTAATLVTFLFFLSSDLPWYSLILLPFAALTGSWACYAMPTAGFLLYPFGPNHLGLTPMMGATGYTVMAIAGILGDGARWARRRSGSA